MTAHFLRHTSFCILTVLGLLLASVAPARAQAAPAAEATAEPEPPQPLGVSVTLSNSLVTRGQTGQATLLTGLEGTYAWNRWLSSFVRLAVAHNVAGTGRSGTSFASPATGFSGQVQFGEHGMLTAQAGATVPVGSGGGNAPDPAAVQAWMSGLDWVGPAFAVNHVDLFTGLKASYAFGKVTLQVESTLHELRRVAGEHVDPIGAVATVTGSQATLFYAVLPRLTLSAAVFETRFWNTPKVIEASPASRLDYYLLVGASTNLKVAGLAVAPGFVYGRALDLPLVRERFQVFELDLGFAL